MPRLPAFLFVAALTLVVAVLAVACGGGLSEAEQHNENGLELADEGLWEEAIAEYDQAVELDPEFASAYSNRGNAYTELADFDQAIADINADFDQAIADWDKAVSLTDDADVIAVIQGLIEELGGP